jgi:DNA-binding MarR family transcriptional regulator
MSDLSRRLMVTGGNITGITDQLEREGLVVRINDPVDRRAFTVKLTPSGRRFFAKMAAVHEQWVIELFSSLSGAEKEQAGCLLAKLKLGLGSQLVTQTENTGKR